MIEHIQNGDFVVVKRSWQAEVFEAIRATPQTIFYIDKNSKKERRLRPQEVLFVGSKEIANRLAQQLISSSSLCAEEVNKSGLRRIARDARYLAEANSAAMGSKQALCG